MKIFKVKDWSERFESAKSREYNHRSQSYTPNKHGLGYRRILASEHGEAVFGCWMATCQVLSRQEKPRQGYLTDTGRPDGVPYGPDDISLVTGYSVKTCAKMLEICSSHGVGWLDVVQVADTVRIPQSTAKDAQSDYPLPSPLPLPSPSPPAIAEGFERFWLAYPRKIGKGAAIKAWKRATLPDIESILLAVERQMRSEQWTKDGGQFIPHPSTWINQMRWLDEAPERNVDAEARRREHRNAHGFSISRAIAEDQNKPGERPETRPGDTQ